MSRCDRRSYRAAGGALILSIVLQGIVGIASAQPGNVGIPRNPGEQAGQESSPAQPPRAPPQAEDKPAYTADYERACSEPQDAGEADLCQQWRSANAAERIVELTSAQVEWTKLEFAALFATLIATTFAAWAAAIAAIATRHSVQVSDETARRQLRAYVFVDSAELLNFRFRPRVLPEARIVMRNSGQTPAYEFTSVVSMTAGQYPPRSEFPSLPDGFTEKDVIGPHSNVISFPKLSEMLTEEQEDATAEGSGAIWVFGEIRYKDTFGVQRYTRFRYIFGGNMGARDGGALAADAEGNEAD